MTDLIYAYVTRSLNPELRREFEHHLSICPDCVNFFNTYKKTVGSARDLEASDIPSRVRRSVLSFLRQRMRRLGALVFFVLSQFTS